MLLSSFVRTHGSGSQPERHYSGWRKGPGRHSCKVPHTRPHVQRDYQLQRLRRWASEVFGPGHMSGVHKPGIAQALHPLLPCINVTQPGTARVPGLICIRLPVTSGMVHLKCDGTLRDASPTGVLLSASGTIGLRHKPRARSSEVCLLRSGASSCTPRMPGPMPVIGAFQGGSMKSTS